MTAAAIDLFAGGGGWSLGWQQATGVSPAVAVNHCPHAVRLHALNHPDTVHFCEAVQSIDPLAAAAGRRIDWLHLSPDCTHFSRAKGGKPREQNIRGLAWCGVDWAERVRPRVLSLENVAEFEGWGPLDDDGQPIRGRAGETFREFVEELTGLGYRVEWRVLCAADFGAPTIRRRLFMLARRDGRPIRWPEPTHGEGRAHPWRSAAECIDWSIPCPSIFERRRPLADATCRRIAAGVVRYVLNDDDPFVAPAGLEGRIGADLAAAWLAKHYGGVVGSDLRAPLGTITSQDHHSLVMVSPTGPHAEKVVAFLTSYYSGGGASSDLRDPMPAVVTKDRHGLVCARLHGGDMLTVADIGLRMLTPRELARAQGFPDSYVLEGTKAQQIARIGNSVVPQIAAALVRANLNVKETP